MASQVPLICLISLLLLLLGCVAQTQITQDNILNYVDTDFLDYDASFLNRSSFGNDLIFGAASSAYQYEGAWNEGGRGPSIWDTYTHQYPERIANSRYGRNADVTTDQYHRYKEDVGIMKGMNFDAYRFSISWSRLLPNGKRSGGLNEDGVNYYKSLIKELKDAGLKPFVTLFHWDLPQALEDEYGGFLDRRIVDDFKDFAKLCFDEFGEDVKHWITFNEPYIFSTNGYATGNFAPGRCTPARNERNCTGGNSATEPYLVAHHQLLAHAAVVKLYKEEYQESQKGEIGITLIAHWYIPYSNKRDDQNAALRDMDFMFGWFMHPLTFGDYPPIMRSKVGERLPKFDSEESKLVEGSFDFIGINYYTAYYSSHAPNDYIPSYTSDSHTTRSSERDGVPIGEKAGSNWLNIYAQGLRDLLLYTKIKYNNPEIYITENGIDEKIDDFKLSLNQPLIIDSKRIRSYFNHLTYLREAIINGVTVKGYFVWSLLDNFEWASGYTSRFGIYYVDFLNEQKRHPKLSALWFKKFLGVGGAQSIS